MDVTISNLGSTGEISACLRQLDLEFGARLKSLAAQRPPFERMQKLFIFTVAGHPLGGGFHEPGRGSYSKAENRYLVGSAVLYDGLISPSWADRVAAYAATASRATKKIAKTRVTEEERTSLLELIASAANAAVAEPPETLSSPEPVFVRDPASASRNIPLLGFGGHRAPGMIEVRPEEIESYRQFVEAASAPAADKMFKLYATAGSQMMYREGWTDDAHAVHEHWGPVGERGDHKEHAHTDAVAAHAALAQLKQAALNAGYVPLAPGRHATLVVEYSSNDPSVDLARRHALEDFLNELTAWLGLGHVDGGSIGSGTMEVFCIVVDYGIARDAIAAALRESRFAGFSRIYRMK